MADRSTTATPRRSHPPLWLVEGLDVVEQRRGLLVSVMVGVVIVGLGLALFLPGLVPPVPAVGAAVAVAAMLLALAAALAIDTADLTVRGPRHVGAAGGELVAVLPVDARSEAASELAAAVLDAREGDGTLLLGLASAGRDTRHTISWTDALAVALVHQGVSVLRIDLASGRSEPPGLVEVVRDNVRLARAVTFEPVLRLARLGAGRDHLEAITALTELPQSLPRDLDVLLVALPTAASRQVVEAARVLDHMLIVAERDRTSRVELIAGLDALESAGTQAQVALLDDRTAARLSVAPPADRTDDAEADPAAGSPPAEEAATPADDVADRGDPAVPVVGTEHPSAAGVADPVIPTASGVLGTGAAAVAAVHLAGRQPTDAAEPADAEPAQEPSARPDEPGEAPVVSPEEPVLPPVAEAEASPVAPEPEPTPEPEAVLPAEPELGGGPELVADPEHESLVLQAEPPAVAADPETPPSPEPPPEPEPAVVTQPEVAQEPDAELVAQPEEAAPLPEPPASPPPPDGSDDPPVSNLDVDHAAVTGRDPDVLMAAAQATALALAQTPELAPEVPSASTSSRQDELTPVAADVDDVGLAAAAERGDDRGPVDLSDDVPEPDDAIGDGPPSDTEPSLPGEVDSTDEIPAVVAPPAVRGPETDHEDLLRTTGQLSSLIDDLRARLEDPNEQD